MKGNENKHVRGFRSSKIKPGEAIGAHLEGWIGEMMGDSDKRQHNGQLIITNMRVCFYRKGFIGEVFETIPLEKITSVEVLSRMGYKNIRLHTSHDELSFKTFESKECFDAAFGCLESFRSPSASSAQGDSCLASIPDQIRQLAELMESGIISSEEFSLKKEELLRRM